MEHDAQFPFITRWGQILGHGPTEIAATLAAAHHDRAPSSAVFRSKTTGAWRTIHDITAPATRANFIARGWMTSDWTIPGEGAPAL